MQYSGVYDGLCGGPTAPKDGGLLKYFLDTEFIESGRFAGIQLVSIGIVAEDGREFYAISSDFDAATASQWVVDNVLANLDPDVARLPVCRIADDVRAFVDGDPEPQFWAYYADYDWVVFCQMFGTMMDLPKGFPMYCRDIKQWCDQLGNPDLPKQGEGEHNALADAYWNRSAWNFLNGGA